MERPKDIIIEDLNNDLSYLYELVYKLMADIHAERRNGDTVSIDETLSRLSQIAKCVINAQKDYTMGFAPDGLKDNLMNLLDSRQETIDFDMNQHQR